MEESLLRAAYVCQGRRPAECRVCASPGRGSRVLAVGEGTGRKHWTARLRLCPGPRASSGTGGCRVCEVGGGRPRKKIERREPGYGCGWRWDNQVGPARSQCVGQCGWRTGVCLKRGASNPAASADDCTVQVHEPTGPRVHESVHEPLVDQPKGLGKKAGGMELRSIERTPETPSQASSGLDWKRATLC